MTAVATEDALAALRDELEHDAVRAEAAAAVEARGWELLQFEPVLVARRLVGRQEIYDQRRDEWQTGRRLYESGDTLNELLFRLEHRNREFRSERNASGAVPRGR